MKKIVMLLLVMVLGLSMNSYAKSKVYGKGISVDNTTKVSAILDFPEKYLGKQVKVEGIIIEVCASRGCWVYVSSDRQYEKIQVKVTDGEIVFPMSAAGHQAAVEGIVEELKMSKEDMINWFRHQAEEKGESFDPSQVKSGQKIVRLIGIGAEIED